MEGYRFRHGYAVAIGMVYVAELARLAGRSMTPWSTGTVRSWPRRPADVVHRGGVARAARAMRVDKKARGSRLRFVVLDAVADPGLLENPAEDLLRRAYREIAD